MHSSDFTEYEQKLMTLSMLHVQYLCTQQKLTAITQRDTTNFYITATTLSPTLAMLLYSVFPEVRKSLEYVNKFISDT